MPQFICSKCSRKYDITTLDYKCECEGLFNLDFTPTPFSLKEIDTAQWNLFRYRKFFPIENDLWEKITLGEGMTPTLKLEENTFVKLDYAMPTLSFKDRGAALLIWHCKSIGVKKVVQDSSGNAGNSIAAYAGRAGIECEIFVPKGTSPKKIDMIKSHGATVTVFDGSRDETADACRKKAYEEKLYYASHVYNPMFYQGTKTYIYEVFEQLGRLPDNIFIPVGNGTLLLGSQIAINELFAAGAIKTLPKLFIVQSQHCAPLYNAKELPNQIEVKETMAEGIAIGKPMRGEQMLKNDYQGERQVILIEESTILPAREKLAKQGFFVEHTTAAIYAAYLQYKENNTLVGDSLISLCGAGLKSQH